ncbi:cytochrome P450 [Xylaria arbuscula]|nr:cytochrome P450 [Xylaria arbuscula]
MRLADLFTIAAYAACYAAPLVVFLLGVYRVKLHPIQKYPGPFLAKLSDLYGGFYAVGKRTHLKIWENHLRYGSVVRFGPNRLLFNTATAMRDIHQNPDMNKSYLYTYSRLGGSPSIFSTLETKPHRQKRQVFSQALGDRSLSVFEPTMLEHIDTFLKLILKSTRNSEPFDMSSHCQHLSFDIIGSLAVGQRLNLQLEETNRTLLRLLIVSKYRVNMIMHFPLLRVLNPMLKLIPSQQARDFKSILGSMFKLRAAQDVVKQRDLYSFLLNPNCEGMFENVLSEIVFFITAGGTPTATTVCTMFFHLSRNPECYKLLASEIRSTFSSANEIKTGAQLSSCKYLRACIDESLRISTPSLATLWREQSNVTREAMIIDGHVVPRGTQVGVNIYALHHNEEYFPEPFCFKPERWLEPDQAGNMEEPTLHSKMRDAFVPFIVGSRSCVGKAMVYQEVSLIVAKTVWYFDFEPCPGALGRVGEGEVGNRNGRNRVDEFQLFDVFNSHHQGPNLIFRTRGGWYTDLTPHATSFS